MRFLSTTQAEKIWSVWHKGIGTLLIMLSIAKFEAVLSDQRWIHVATPIFGFTLFTLLTLAGAVELMVGIFFLGTEPALSSAIALGGFVVALIAYRAILWISNWRIPCGCLGSFASFLGLSVRAVNWISYLILILFASYIATVIIRKIRRS